ncbi:MAG: DUF899 family protein [Phycisphaerae bacterium]|nr:DUF899 family protein [Phycisphaerae bacterium]
MPTITTSEVRELETAIEALKKKLTEARRRAVPEVVADLTLLGRDGTPKRLSDFFGTRNDLLLVHNMGRRCQYCTLWADGLIGFWPHLNDRSAFALVSEDAPPVLDEFARSRNWPFPVASMHGSDFANALGVGYDDTHQHPGVSAFHRRDDGTIVRTGYAPFGPGDDFCSVWPLFDLLQGGASGWAPKYKYGGSCGPSCGCA